MGSRSLPSGLTRYMADLWLCSGSEEKTMLFPSGNQATSKTWESSSITFVAPVRLLFTIQIESLLPRPSGPRQNASRLLSGDHFALLSGNYFRDVVAILVHDENRRCLRTISDEGYLLPVGRPIRRTGSALKLCQLCVPRAIRVDQLNLSESAPVANAVCDFPAIGRPCWIQSFDESFRL